MDSVANASEAGGGKLMNPTPEQARMNLILGYANLVLARVDGLAVAPTALAKVMKVRSCSKSVELELNREAKLKAINEQSNHNIMHQDGFGETNSFAS
jgi:hypothetical protein